MALRRVWLAGAIAGWFEAVLSATFGAKRGATGAQLAGAQLFPPSHAGFALTCPEATGSACLVKVDQSAVRLHKSQFPCVAAIVPCPVHHLDGAAGSGGGSAVFPSAICLRPVELAAKAM